ncbi:hypothetical protein FRC19_002207 [Serendipita sp. 401]|nr:hypothetical protein FRC19_002207 [Serendipita sp. 401]
MSKRLARPQPITAPAPESFLPSFDFASPQKSRTPKALPQRKMPPLSKRLAAFAFLNLEDIVEEVDEMAMALHSHHSISPVSTSSKGARFWEFGKSKNHHDKFASPTTPASLPPMSSKAYATLVGGAGAGGGSSATSGSKPLFTPPPSKVIRPAAAPSNKPASPIVTDPLTEFESDQQLLSLTPEEKRSLAVDLVSIFSVASDDMESDKSRFSFPMPPSFVPRRGSQSPLDPDMSFTSMISPATLNSPLSPDSPDSGFTEYSFFSPLFSPGFANQQAKPAVATEKIPVVVVEESISPFEKVQEDTKVEKRRPTRPFLTIPPALPPPSDSPPATPVSPTLSERRAMALKRVCPSPDLDPEYTAHSSIESLLIGDAETMSESGADDSSSQTSLAPPPPPTSKALPSATPTGINFGNWNIGSPSRSDSIVTITQRTYNAMRGRGSIGGSFSTIHGSFSGPSLGRNGSWGSGEVYDNWEQAIDDIYLHISRKPSLASIAYAASAEGAALPSTTLDVVGDAAFVMDDEMRRKLMESQFLIPTRVAPAPPSPKGSMRSDMTKSTLSLPEDDSEYVTASATSSARSSLDERRSSPLLAPVPEPRPHQNTNTTRAPVIAPLRLKRPAPSNLAVPTNAEPLTPSFVQSPRPNARPPPMQSVPSSDTDSSIFSPLSAAPFSSLSQPIDIDSWPQWSSIGASLEAKRKARRPSENGTMISKFSDDSFEVTSKQRKRSGTTSSTKSANKVKKSSMKTTTTTGSPTKLVNLSPGSSHTSYTFLGLKKKTSSGAVVTPTPMTGNGKSEKGSPKAVRESFESTQSGSSGEGGSKKYGLRRPPLPLELFIRA